MPMDKKVLIKKFQKNPNKYWQVDLFSELGFKRRQCKSCGKFFWALTEQDICNDSTCRPYDFIGDPPTKKHLDYFETWKVIENFFVKNGHISIKPYPTVCRWFNLYFTIAGIVDFYRMENGNLAFEFPANPTILPQPCLRFNDVVNTGINGKSYTSFSMIQQSSLYNGKEGYWKDKCIELDFNLLTKAFGIKPDEIVFVEDAWIGPSAFGSSLEYHVRGLELGNAVFTEFVGTPDNYKEMKDKVIDMGAGHERLAWITQGTPTSYDVTFGPVMKKLIKACGIDYDKDFFLRYSKLAGGLNLDEVSNLEVIRRKIAGMLNVSIKELEEKVSPMEAIYAVADHARTLLFAISDAGLPSNTAGGYNLRVVLRRALGFIDKFKWNIDLKDVVLWHADYLKNMFPNVSKHRDEILKILKVEEDRYRQTKERSKRIIESLGGNKITEDELIKLYDSEVITPEQLVVKTPDDFYAKITEKHMSERPEKEEPKLDLKGLPETKVLFYKDPGKREFSARVLRIDKEWVMLDQTLFYPEGGGQAYDLGFIGNKKVLDVQKFGNVVAHKIEGSPGFRKGQTVKGRIDWPRRLQLMQHHTAIHVINGAARKVLGNHVWQAGSGKTPEKAHLDITHYQSLSEKEIGKIEELANQVVRKGLKVESLFLPRAEAERRFGMRIYQGGAIPDKTLRIINTRGFDTEACAGTHLSNTGEIGRIVVLSSERIQDGVDRITIKAGKSSEDYGRENLRIAGELIKLIRRDLHFAGFSPGLLKNLRDPAKAIRELQAGAGVFSVRPGQLEATLRKFCRGIVENSGRLDILGRQLRMERETLGDYLRPREFKSLRDVCGAVFRAWKLQNKELEKLRGQAGKSRAENLIKKAKKGEVFDVLEGDRRELISIANEVLGRNPGLTIILANQSGDIIGMSRSRDMGQAVRELCGKAGGSGGGSPGLGQGKAELSRFLKVMGFDMRIAGKCFKRI